MSNRQESDDAKDFLRASGLVRYNDLFVDLPELERLAPPNGAERDARRRRTERRDFAASVANEDGPVYLGSGFYDHDVPSAVDRLASQLEFERMNASGDDEIGDELFRTIAMFQNVVRRLTGMSAVDVALYRRGFALARACLAAVETTGRRVVLAPETLGTELLESLKARVFSSGAELRTIPNRGGLADVDAIRRAAANEGERIAAAIAPYPNFFGCLERVGQISNAVRSVGALLVMSVDPVVLAALRSPAEWGADLAVGDAHATAIHSEDGAARLGFVAASRRFLASAPERVARRVGSSSGGETLVLSRTFGGATSPDATGRSRERARGAFKSLVYLARTDWRDLRRAALSSHQIAARARAALANAGFQFHYDAPFWREFAVKLDDPRGMLENLERWGIVGGYELDDGLILAFTEKRRPEEIDELAYFMKEFRDGARRGVRKTL